MMIHAKKKRKRNLGRLLGTLQTYQKDLDEKKGKERKRHDT